LGVAAIENMHKRKERKECHIIDTLSRQKINIEFNLNPWVKKRTFNLA
jgi:hypothetical protein